MDTIFALASAPGKAGVSVIRISGTDAKTAGVSLSGGELPKPRQSGLRILKRQSGEHLDQALVLVFDAGASFTGEDVVEFQVHGSVAVVSAVLDELSKIPGLRMAEPGEFTRRALENGCMDLTQVEALSDLIESETEAQRKQALRVLSGAIGQKVDIWRSKIVRSAALLEATIDFADEDVPVDVTDEVKELLQAVINSIESELCGLNAAERVRTGFEVAIVGPPNAGKSTLLNYLAGRDAAITSEFAGTTRDVIEVQMDIGGYSVTLLDTAGVRETDDQVEKIGVERALSRAKSADLRIHLVLLGESPEIDVEESDIILTAKDDLGCENGISGLTGFGVVSLLDHIRVTLSTLVSGSSLVNRERHKISLRQSLSFLREALVALESGVGEYDLVSEELRSASRNLEALMGRVDVENLLDEIFLNFCVGK
ncbi:tRNA uridine-5-carboxymethylaminomethyl(34) synthesis GTPase MnmE [uncultured Pelagimonas sp.]|uniref:tRNA uridine-5-carboxymethylaminomethyl(34) synthesis GTPase MnmE n=1 Tax=uncultured Pelagimonas sp. TaxID=1618102 RepID=UPI00261E4CB8|nr:tRNA uridine-5-carboxymethylaminomethyl(34) synthesis GTPase MnmE [uncultured Pelagimonas sp.]